MAIERAPISPPLHKSKILLTRAASASTGTSAQGLKCIPEWQLAPVPLASRRLAFHAGNNAVDEGCALELGEDI
jgi:hypothetical protein